MSQRSSGLLGPVLAWGIVFADIGTSVYYVPGLLFTHPGVGTLAGAFVSIVALAGGLLAIKYADITARFADGGGVVSVATSAFNPVIGALGGMLITVNYFFTSSISSMSGIHYLASILPIHGWEVPIACLALILLGLLNWIGIKESAIVSLGMAATAFVVQLIVVGITVVQLSVQDWTLIRTHLFEVTELPAGTFLYGFGAAWLAFSGLETLSQLSPAIKDPKRSTANVAMALVLGSVFLTSPLLTAFSASLLSVKLGAVPPSEHFISALGFAYGGLPLKIAVVASASTLLVFAANTAIIGCYHVFLALTKNGFLPSALADRSERFGTPHVAIIVATFVPVCVVIATGTDMSFLGDMYAFGLLGAFVLSSAGLDRLRWVERQRDWQFYLGLVVTVLLFLAWGVNIYSKYVATLVGTIVVGCGMGLAFGVRQGWFTRASEVGYTSEVDAEAAASALPSARQILTLAEAVDLKMTYSSKTLVAVRGFNPRLVAETAARAKGIGDMAVYVVFVDEVPGIFYPPKMGPTEDAQTVLEKTCAALDDQNMIAVPIWRMAHDSGVSIAAAAKTLDVSAVFIGTTRRTALWKLLRGNVLLELIKSLPESIRLTIVN